MKMAFTLIELVIVICVIVIFSSISIPLYQRYTLRALFAAGKTQVVPMAKKALMDLAARGTCLPTGVTTTTYSFSVDDPSSALASYTLLNASTGYEGCMVLGFFKAADKGGNPKLAGKAVRVHYARVTGGNSFLITTQCFTSVAAADLGLVDGEEGCVYDQAWADKP